MSKEALNRLHGEAVLQLQLLSAAHFKPPQAKATSGIPGVRQVQDPCEPSTSSAAEGKLPGGGGGGGRSRGFRPHLPRRYPDPGPGPPPAPAAAGTLRARPRQRGARIAPGADCAGGRRGGASERQKRMRQGRGLGSTECRLHGAERRPRPGEMGCEKLRAAVFTVCSEPGTSPSV